MELLYQIILPGVLLPLVLSFTLWITCRRNAIAAWGIVLAWLPSYIWIAGWPEIIPAEANDWFWLLAVISSLVGVFYSSRDSLFSFLQTALLVVCLIAISWPVLKYQFSIILVLELLAVALASYFIYRASSTDGTAAPALLMVISAGGMAIVIASVGSLLLGQLAGVLAIVLSVFGLHELSSKLRSSLLELHHLGPAIQIYLVLLVTARIFAELPVAIAFLLLVAPLGLLIKHKYAYIYTSVLVLAAVVWAVQVGGPSGY